jgi:hypothetical protein
MKGKFGEAGHGGKVYQARRGGDTDADDGEGTRQRDKITLTRVGRCVRSKNNTT